jgi:NADH-quinone oxidoreductase subunit C
MTPGEIGVALRDRFGERASAEVTFGLLTADVPAELWIPALTWARDELGCSFFDWLSAVDELDEGFSVVVHVWSPQTHRDLLIRTRVPRERPELATATGVFRGASWHERETAEMFGIGFAGHPDPRPLLLPDGFEGRPLRKEFILAARAAKPWPGAKNPGESGPVPARRSGRMLPPGVPKPGEWGPSPEQEPALDREAGDGG